MKRILKLVGLGAALLVASCGDDEKTESPGGGGSTNPTGGGSPTAGNQAADTVQGLAAEFGKQLDQLGQALRGVKDIPSAEKVAEIAPLACGQFKDIAYRLTALEVPSDAVKTEITKEIEAREEELARSLGGQEDFLNTLDLASQEIVKKAMAEFIRTMEEIQPVMEKYFLVASEEAVPPPAPPEPGPPVEPTPDPVDPQPGAPAPAPAPVDPPVPTPTPSPAPAPAPVPAPE